MGSAELYEKGRALEAEAQAVFKQAAEAKKAELMAQPLGERLIYSAYARCECGLGFAYDPAGEACTNKDSPLRTPSQWECSGILLKTAERDKLHTPPLPFAFYDVKSENQPSANGQTTRPKE